MFRGGICQDLDPHLHLQETSLFWEDLQLSARVETFGEPVQQEEERPRREQAIYHSPSQTVASNHTTTNCTSPTTFHQRGLANWALASAADAEFGWGPVRDKWKPNPPPNLRLSFAAQSRVFSSFCRGSGAFKFLPWIRRLQASAVEPATSSLCCRSGAFKFCRGSSDFQPSS